MLTLGLMHHLSILKRMGCTHPKARLSVRFIRKGRYAIQVSIYQGGWVDTLTELSGVACIEFVRSRSVVSRVPNDRATRLGVGVAFGLVLVIRLRLALGLESGSVLGRGVPRYGAGLAMGRAVSNTGNVIA